jgi:hypothetical protein
LSIHFWLAIHHLDFLLPDNAVDCLQLPSPPSLTPSLQKGLASHLSNNINNMLASANRPASSDGPARSPLPASEYPTTASSSCHDPSVLSHNALHRWSLSTRTIASYVRLDQIGEGTYGQVYRARPVSTGDDKTEFVALKKIRLHHPGFWGIPPTVLREIKILKQLSHKNMVKMLEVVSSKGVEHLDWEEDSSRSRELKKKKVTKVSNSTASLANIATNNNNYDSNNQASTPCIDSDYNKYKENDDNNDTDEQQNPDSAMLKQFADLPNDKKKYASSSSDVDALRESYKGSLFLVLEYVSHDLTGLLDMAYKFTEVQAKSLMQQLLEVLEYMHEKKFVHRDLKSSNLLITSQFRVKLAVSHSLVHMSRAVVVHANSFKLIIYHVR